MILDELPVPIVLAPLAGGPSTPRLTAAVSEAGGLGFLAAGYLTADTLRARLDETRALTQRSIGVNLFVPGRPTAAETVARYSAGLADEAARVGAALGEPRFEDDDWRPKLDLLTETPVTVVSFTFGCPAPDVIERLHGVGSEVWVTVTREDEAVQAVGAGADALVVQGAEAGGHRSAFVDDPDDRADGIGLLSLLQLVRHAVAVPLVAAGGIATGSGVAAALAAGASAAQLGTAFLRCPEAGTAPVHRQALASSVPTAMTRAFTGRLARGVLNRFLDEHSDEAPVAYPEIHHVTAPLRQAARAAGDADLVNLWAGQAYTLARDVPAGELVGILAKETDTALTSASARLRRP
ncbi:nitronate monooxygenase [Actinoallomurus sp. NPDC050550]|uniref:NAD(P)H-dependent flavin oxidoreductase n=1 Tax=Actinoallomurus sp. NPDC050550 TaxID=3154937 RepID=UPI0033D43A25